MGNIQSYIASKQPVSSGGWRFKPWTPWEGEMGDLEAQVEEGVYNSCVLSGLLP